MVISTSVSASISNWPSADELIPKAESLNCNCLVLFNNTPVSATWVRVTSLSAPKLNTAASDNNLRSSPITASFTTLNPPSVWSDPSVVDVASVASSVFIIPDDVIAPEATAPANVLVPDTSRAPFKSTVVVVISTSTSASISNWPSVEEFIFKALSLNCNWLVLFKSTPASATWVRVTSWSFPKLITEPSARKRLENSAEAVPR